MHGPILWIHLLWNRRSTWRVFPESRFATHGLSPAVRFFPNTPSAAAIEATLRSKSELRRAVCVGIRFSWSPCRWRPTRLSTCSIAAQFLVHASKLRRRTQSSATVVLRDHCSSPSMRHGVAVHSASTFSRTECSTDVWNVQRAMCTISQSSDSVTSRFLASNVRLRNRKQIFVDSRAKNQCVRAISIGLRRKSIV